MIMTKFFWGNSSSSMQTEGGWNEGGKSLSVYDVRKPGPLQMIITITLMKTLIT